MSANPQPRRTLRSFISARDGVMESAATRAAIWRRGEIPGPITGFKDLDKILGGYLRPGIHVLHGGPGVGKSALTLSFARQCLAPSLIYSTELPDEEIYLRLVAQHTGVDMWQLDRMNDAELGPLYDTTGDAYPMIGVCDVTVDTPSLEDLKHGITVLQEKYRGKTRAHGILAVVDSVHTFAMRAYSDMLERDRLDHALTNLEMLGKTLKVPIICVAERNRQSREESGQTAAKGTSKFEYSGESILGLDVDKKAMEEDPDGPLRCYLTTSKSRKGRAGKGVGLLFNGSTMQHRLIADTSDLEGTPW